jgi:hypothetical protein
MTRYVTILLAFAAFVCAVKDKPKAEHKHVWMSTTRTRTDYDIGPFAIDSTEQGPAEVKIV